LYHPRVLYAILLLTILIPTLLFASPAPVHASDMTTAPSSGTVGTIVHIEGNGFSGGLATVYWDSRSLLSKIPISEAGDLIFDFQVPSDSKGIHTIRISDDSNWANSTASATFTITPGITVFPSVGRPYSSITVTGSGFTRLEKDIKVTWDKNVVPVTATANYDGLWSVSFDAPGPDKGEHYISAFSTSTAASDIGEHKFIIGPFAEIQPRSGSVGAEISMVGYGFRTSEDGITITWDNQIIVCNLIAGMNGELNTMLNIPVGTQGHHLVGLFGSDFTPKGNIPDMDFNIIPNIELQPPSGNKGTKVTVYGTGFGSGETISLSFEGINLNTNTLADEKGSFSTSFITPQSGTKENKVKATGTAGNLGEALFTIERVVPPAPMPIFPRQGDKIEAFGSVGEVFLGAIKQLFTIMTFRHVRQGEFGLYHAVFDWSDINAQGKITYTLEIIDGNDFSLPLILKSGITESEYKLPGDDILSIGSHSWRVRAMDDIGNEGFWSEPQEFEVIPMSSHVLILSVIIPLIFISVVVVLAIIIWRRYKFRG
jgi:hypothetical protein